MCLEDWCCSYDRSDDEIHALLICAKADCTGETQETEAAGHTAQNQLSSMDIFQVVKFGDKHPCVLA